MEPCSRSIWSTRGDRTERAFGAQIYVSHLVGIGMPRDIAPIMTGIIVTGRTGASFAAEAVLKGKQ